MHKNYKKPMKNHFNHQVLNLYRDSSLEDLKPIRIKIKDYFNKLFIKFLI